MGVSSFEVSHSVHLLTQASISIYLTFEATTIFDFLVYFSENQYRYARTCDKDPALVLLYLRFWHDVW